MALQSETDPATDALDQLNRYMSLIVYEYVLRREAGLEAKEAVRWSFRRVLPPPDGLHPILAMIAGYKVESDVPDSDTARLLHTVIVACDRQWRNLQGMDGWRPGTIGMGW